MKLEQQVVGLELSQKLKELGVKQESKFYWVWEHVNIEASLPAEPEREWRVIYEEEGIPIQEVEVSAFTVAELGEMLPDHIDTSKWQYDLSCWKEDDGWRIHYGRIGQLYEQLEAPTEADARAKMLIYLLENKLITI